MRGRIVRGKLMVAATDLTGRAVSLSAPVPTGAFLSAPGIGGSIPLVEKLAGMKPGSKRTLTSLALEYLPAIAIVSARYKVERKPDAGHNRVYAVATTQGGLTVTGELVVDDAGFIVAQTLGPPVATTTTRRPR